MASTTILPFAVWAAGTNQNSLPANDNSLRNQILNGLVISKAVTSQPPSPAEGDIYILASTHTGSQWSGFAPDDLVIYSGGTWYAFEPSQGVVVNFEGHQEQFTGSDGWSSVGGGGGSSAWSDLTGVPAPITDIAALTDPGADRILFWDDSAGIYTHLTVSTGLNITGTTLTATGGGGGTPAGSDKQVQYNNAGAFGAEAGFEYDQSTNTFTVPKVNESKGSDIASSATADLGAATGNFVHITGTTTITSFGTVAAGARRLVVFDGALTLTHNGTSLILPTGGNITTAAGDAALCVSEGSGNWRVTFYQKKDGTALVGGGGGGLTGFTSSLSSASPNGTVNVSQMLASGGSTDQDAAFQPKGVGAFLAQLPDSTTAGGNKRGSNAVDLQTTRTAADQVASGATAVIGGGKNNKCEGATGVIGGGTTNTIGSGRTNAVICGGSSNVIGGSLNVIGGGNSNNAAGTKSVIGGGESNATSVGDYITISGGDRNVASNYNSTVGGGSQNTASGDSSTVTGGAMNTAEGASSTAMGNNAYARTRGSVANAAGNFASLGDSQVERLVHRINTTNATPAAMSGNGSAPSASTCALLPNNSVYAFEVTVVGKVATFGDRGSWKITGQVARGASAGTTVIDGTPTSTTIATVGGASAWVVAVSANTTLGSLEVTVTGAASTNIKWVSHIVLTEVVG